MENYLDYLADLIKKTLVKYPKRVVNSLKDLPLTGVNGVRKVLGGFDLEFFSKAYFPEYHEVATPEFHKEAYAELDKILNSFPNRARKVRAWPRANAKSTIYNFFTPANAALYGKRRMVVQVSDSESQAESFLNDIKTAFETNEHIQEDFGEVQGAVWRSDMISVKALSGETVWLVALGAGSSIRGLRKAQHRPDLIIVDDLEDDESVMTQERIEKMWSWFNKALMNLGDRRTDVVVVGTVLADGCVFDRLLKSPAWDAKKLEAVIRWSNSPLWDVWTRIYTSLELTKDERDTKADEFFNAHKEEMLKGTAVLWPEGQSYDYLMKVYTEIGEASFSSEYQNDPVNLEDALFNRNMLAYYDDDELRRVRILEYYGAVDPSMGKTRISDYTAIIVLGRGDNGFLYVLEAIIERMRPDKLIDTLLQIGRTYQFTRFGIEVNQAQELFRLMLVEKGAKEGLYLPLVEIRHNKDKVLRVQALLPFIKNHYVKFSREHKLLIDQLCGFPKLRYDDGPDCLEMAVRMVSPGPSMEPMATGVVERSRYVDDDDDVSIAPFGTTFYS